jgi:hypothetical protein
MREMMRIASRADDCTALEGNETTFWPATTFFKASSPALAVQKCIVVFMPFIRPRDFSVLPASPCSQISSTLSIYV